MYDDYYSQRIYNELVVVNENLVELNSNIQQLNTTTSTLLAFVISIGILFSANLLHHILDSMYKFKGR